MGLVAMWRFLPILVTVCLGLFQGPTCQASSGHAGEAFCNRAASYPADKPAQCAAEPSDPLNRDAYIAERESPEDDDQLSRGIGGPNCVAIVLDCSLVARLAAQCALLGPARPLRILLECWRN
jgi:hypothetical protein